MNAPTHRRIKTPRSTVGDMIRSYAAAYAVTGQKEHAEGMIQAADTVDAQLAGTSTGLIDNPIVAVLLTLVQSFTRSAERITDAADRITAAADVVTRKGAVVPLTLSPLTGRPALDGLPGVDLPPHDIKPRASARPASSSSPAPPSSPRTSPARPPSRRNGAPRDLPAPSASPTSSPATSSTRKRFEESQARLLLVLRDYPEGRDRKDLAALAGFSVKGGGFAAQLREALEAGLVATDGFRYQLTSAGHARVPKNTAPRTGRAALDAWLERLPETQAAILEALATAYPRELKGAELAELLAMAHKGGGFGRNLRELARLRVIENHRGSLRAAGAFFEGAEAAR